MSDTPEWMEWKTGTVLWRLKDGRWKSATVQGVEGSGETRMVAIGKLFVQARRLFGVGFRQARKNGE